MIVWWLDLQLPVQSVPVATSVVGESRSWRGVLDAALCDGVGQWQVCGFLRVVRFPFTNKAYCRDVTGILLKVVLNTITLTLTSC